MITKGLLRATVLAVGLGAAHGACHNDEETRQIGLHEYQGSEGAIIRQHEIACSELNSIKNNNERLDIWFNRNIANGALMIEDTNFVPAPVRLVSLSKLPGVSVVVNKDELAFREGMVMTTKRWEGYEVLGRITAALVDFMQEVNMQWKKKGEGSRASEDLICTKQGTRVQGAGTHKK